MISLGCLLLLALVAAVIPSSCNALAAEGSKAAVKKKAVVVGGGPAALATALTLAREPHSYQVSVFEKSETNVKFDATRAFMYNVNVRGQKFTKTFPDSVHEPMKKLSVPQTEFVMQLVPADPKEALPEEQTMARQSPDGESSYWIPRHEMVDVLMNAVEHEKTKPDCCDITVKARHEFLSVKPSENEDSCLCVTIRDKESDRTFTCEANLLVGADGINSSVREFLASKDSTLAKKWEQYLDPAKFVAVQKISPAVGLRLKALQFPARFTIPAGEGEEIETTSRKTYAVRSVQNGPRTYLSLGFLPMSNNDVPRPANFITRPNHELWTITDGPAMKKYVQNAFPRLDFDKLITDEEWDRFAEAQGTYFPPCQYSPGLQVSDGTCGIVLVGDAIHAFPPDIGQGVNVAYEDVVALDKALKEAGEAGESLESALVAYENDRGPEAEALIRYSLIGAPYQYRQPLIKDRIGAFLWLCNFTLRLALNKVSGGLLPTAAVTMANDPDLRFSDIMQRADRYTAALTVVGASLIAVGAYELVLQ